MSGVDDVLVRPHDLSCSLGVPEQYDDPRFDEAIRRTIRLAAFKRVHHLGENSGVRTQLKDGIRELFDTLLETKVLIEWWRTHYNSARPHSSPGYRPPANEAGLDAATTLT